MVSCGPDIQPYNYTHMYSFVDLRGNTPKQCTTPGSIFHYISTKPEFSKFKKIVENAVMTGQLNNLQADFTMLIPTDNFLKYLPENFFTEMDNV